MNTKIAKRVSDYLMGRECVSNFKENIVISSLDFLAFLTSFFWGRLSELSTWYAIVGVIIYNVSFYRSRKKSKCIIRWMYIENFSVNVGIIFFAIAILATDLSSWVLWPFLIVFGIVSQIINRKFFRVPREKNTVLMMFSFFAIVSILVGAWIENNNIPINRIVPFTANSQEISDTTSESMGGIVSDTKGQAEYVHENRKSYLLEAYTALYDYWYVVDNNERLALMTELIYENAYSLGVSFCDEITVVGSKEDMGKTAGFYNHRTKTVTINLGRLDTYNVDLAVEICLHESYHMYEYATIELLNVLPENYHNNSLFSQVIKWRDNFKNYIDSDTDELAYRQQPVEASAYEYEKIRLDELKCLYLANCDDYRHWPDED